MNEKETAAVKRIVAAREALESDPLLISHAAACRKNEEFYLGHQWREGEGGDLTKPVFNVIRRVCDYVISTLCAKEYTISYSLDGLPPELAGDRALVSAVTALTRHIGNVYDREKLEKLLFDVARDAVICGSGVFYTYWDAFRETGDAHTGAFRTVAIDPACIYPADPRSADVQSQEYYILKSRSNLSSVIGEATVRGVSSYDVKRITGEGGKADVTLMLERGEDGRIYYRKECCEVLIASGCTGLTQYPIAVFTPTAKKNSFFGEPLVSGMIPNQLYVNRSYCMLMKHMQDTAFSKVIYDKTRIPEWTGEPGVAIGAHGGGNLADAVSVVGCGELSDGYAELSREVIELTRELHGATDAALGNVDPKNSSAILAAKESAIGILRGSVSLLASAIEDQAKIWADVICTRYGRGRFVWLGGGDGTRDVDFGAVRQALLSCRVEVSDEGKYGTAVSLSVLDKLLECGAITVTQYLERLPRGIIPKRDELIRELGADLEITKNEQK